MNTATEQLTTHFKIWAALGTAKIASVTLEDINTIASIVALFCGAIASISIAYWHICKKPKPPEDK